MRKMVLGIVAGVMLSGNALAQSADNFRINNTSDFVDLCSADPGSSLYTAAIHFCHGFAAGAYRYYEAYAAANPNGRFVCLPDPPPTRSQAIEGFLVWVKARPQYLASPAIDVMFRYLVETYPCRK